jgi:hypothetical protein
MEKHMNMGHRATVGFRRGTSSPRLQLQNIKLDNFKMHSLPHCCLALFKHISTLLLIKFKIRSENYVYFYFPPPHPLRSKTMP